MVEFAIRGTNRSQKQEGNRAIRKGWPGVLLVLEAVNWIDRDQLLRTGVSSHTSWQEMGS